MIAARTGVRFKIVGAGEQALVPGAWGAQRVPIWSIQAIWWQRPAAAACTELKADVVQLAQRQRRRTPGCRRRTDAAAPAGLARDLQRGEAVYIVAGDEMLLVQEACDRSSRR
jgi:hypothetical protein